MSKTLNTTTIPSFWKFGFKKGGYEAVFAATQGIWLQIRGPFFWMDKKHSYKHFQEMASKAFRERDHFARLAQEQADLNYLCSEYMKRRGLPPQSFRAWFRTKEAKILMMKQVEKRKQGAKNHE